MNDVTVALQLDSSGKILNDAMFRTNTSADYIQRAAKVSVHPVCDC